MILAHQADYYVALKTANTQGSSTVFLEFILEMILEALKNGNRSIIPRYRKSWFPALTPPRTTTSFLLTKGADHPS